MPNENKRGRLEMDKQSALVLCTVVMCLSVLAAVASILFFLQSVAGAVTSVMVSEYGSLLHYLLRLVLIPFPLLVLYLVLSVMGKTMRRKVDNTAGDKIVFDKDEIISAIKKARGCKGRK